MASNTIASTVKGPAIKPRLTTLQIFNMSFDSWAFSSDLPYRIQTQVEFCGTMVQMLNIFPGSGWQHQWLD
jgi:hypothetical protein